MGAVTYRGQTSREIAATVEAAVRDGDLAPGEPVPSVRRLAVDLAVSPATVAAAYRELRLRGVLTAEPGSGTRVAPRVVPSPRHGPATLGLGTRDLSNGNPDPAMLPDLGRALRRTKPTQILYGSAAIDPALLEEMTAQFADLGVSVDQLTLVSGAMDGVERVLSAHLLPNDRVAVEDPCYTGVLDLIRTSGLNPLPVSIDDCGMVAADLEQALRAGARACVLSPRAQNPTGAAIDRRRAKELQRVLAGYPDVCVVENDHTGPVAGVDYLSLTAGRSAWALVRSVSKSLGPDLRIAFLAGDPTTINRVDRRLQCGPAWVSHILQGTVLELLREPTTTALVSRAREVYTRRREDLIDALAARGISARGRSGLNVFVPVSEEAPVIRAMENAGWSLRAGEPHRLASAPFVRITAATLKAGDAAKVADDLATALRSERRSYFA